MCEATQIKTCSKCGEEKPLLAFRERKATCRECQNAQTRERRRATGHAISDEAREAKRARDRERGKRLNGTPQRKEVQARYQRTNKYLLVCERRKEAHLFRVGRVCFIAPVTCSECGRNTILRRPPTNSSDWVCRNCAVKRWVVAHKPTRKCLVCSKEMKAYENGAKLYTCSDKCSQMGASASSLTDRVVRKHKGVTLRPMDYIVPGLVFKRDNMQCYICRQRVVLSKKWRPDLATIDHVLPLSKGGTHTYGNVRTACVMCNSKKGDSIDYAYAIPSTQ